MRQQTMLHKFIRLFLFVFMASAGVMPAQEPTNIGIVVHETVEQFKFGGVAGQNWEAAKSSLGAYDKTAIARALIAELDIDRGKADLNKHRDVAVGKFYIELNLPASIILTELANTQSPYKKYQLMRCIARTSSPEILAAMLVQIKDRRIAISPSAKYIEMEGETHPERVCDLAYGIIDQNYGGALPSISWAMPFETRDTIISETLKKLKLTP